VRFGQVATSAQEEVVLCAADHSVLRCLLPDLLYPHDPFFSLQGEAHTSRLSNANLTNSPREGKSFCSQRHCLRPDTESFSKATTFNYSPNPNTRLIGFSEIKLPLLRASQKLGGLQSIEEGQSSCD